jgi:GNAT superfamily N-acetyltransferase
MSRTKVHVRPVEQSDIEAIIALDREITGHPDRGFYEKRFAVAQQNPAAFFFLVALVNGEFAGMISAHTLSGEFGGTTPVGVIDAVGSKPSMRGKGIGRALLAAFETKAKERGVSYIYTEADWKDRELVDFLAAAGYELAPSLALEHVINLA